MNSDICSNKEVLAKNSALLTSSLQIRFRTARFPVFLSHFLVCFFLISSICLTAIAQEQQGNEKNKVNQIDSGSEADVASIFKSNQQSSTSLGASLGSGGNSSEAIKSPEATPSALDSIMQMSANSSQGPKLGILDLEEYIARDRFNKNPTLLERAVLVRVYERIALALCFPPLNTLINTEAPLPLDSNCNNVLDKLAKIHSNNTILICAKNGVDSLECARSHEEQAVRKYQSGEYEKLSLTSKAKKPLDLPEINEKFKSLQKKLFDDIDTLKSQFSITNLKNLDASLYKVLAIICTDDALQLSEKPVKNNANSFADILSNDDSLISEIEGLKSRKPEPTATPKLKTQDGQELALYYRTRILSDSCYDSIVDASLIDNRIASAVCFKEGFLSPSCLSGLRRLKSLKDPNAPEQKVQKDSLASF